MQKFSLWIILLIILVGVIAAMLSNSSGTIVPSFGGGQEVTILFENKSEYDISPGVLVVHKHDNLINYLGQEVPAPYESLAKVGNPEEVINLLRDNTDVYSVYMTHEMSPGGSQTVVVAAEELDAKMSYMAMIVQTNDGVVFLNHIPLYRDDGSLIDDVSIWSEILDMGTEENTPIGSGFAGGQPDPSRGAENIANGTATNAEVVHHTQFYGVPDMTSKVINVMLNASE